MILAGREAGAEHRQSPAGRPAQNINNHRGVRGAVAPGQKQLLFSIQNSEFRNNNNNYYY